MSTPMLQIERYAEELAVNSALLVNKLHAAAVVACQFRPRASEEDFLTLARTAYRSTLERVEESKAKYLGNLTTGKPIAPPATEEGQP